MRLLAQLFAIGGKTKLFLAKISSQIIPITTTKQKVFLYT